MSLPSGGCIGRSHGFGGCTCVHCLSALSGHGAGAGAGGGVDCMLYDSHIQGNYIHAKITKSITYCAQPPQMLQRLVDSTTFQLTPAKQRTTMKSLNFCQ